MVSIVNLVVILLVIFRLSVPAAEAGGCDSDIRGKEVKTIGSINDNPDFPIVGILDLGVSHTKGCFLVLDSENGKPRWYWTDPVVLKLEFRLDGDVPDVSIKLDQGFVSSGRPNGRLIPFWGSPRDALELIEGVVSPFPIFIIRDASGSSMREWVSDYTPFSFVIILGDGTNL